MCHYQNIFAGTFGGGVWRRSIAELVVEEKQYTDPLNIQLSPNPTTGIITIHNAPEDLQSVIVRDVLGEKVIELANPHSSDFTIDLSKLMAGTYYARFQVGSSVVVKKIIKE